MLDRQVLVRPGLQVEALGQSALPQWHHLRQATTILSMSSLHRLRQNARGRLSVAGINERGFDEGTVIQRQTNARHALASCTYRSECARTYVCMDVSVYVDTSHTFRMHALCVYMRVRAYACMHIYIHSQNTTYMQICK